MFYLISRGCVKAQLFWKDVVECRDMMRSYWLSVQVLVPTVDSRQHWTVTPTQLWCPGLLAAASYTITPQPMHLTSHTSRPAQQTAPPVISLLCAVGKLTKSTSGDRARTAPVLLRTGTGSIQAGSLCFYMKLSGIT